MHRLRATWLLSSVLLAIPLSAQTVLAPITRPDFEPRAIAVYEGGNKVFIADDQTGNIYMFDGTTHAELGSAFVGAGVQDMAVHEASGTLYAMQAASNQVAVVDAATCTFLHYVSGAFSGFGEVLVDQTLNKVWVKSSEGLRQIDVATGNVATVPGVYGEDIDLNPLTHELFIATYIPAMLWVV